MHTCMHTCMNLDATLNRSICPASASYTERRLRSRDFKTIKNCCHPHPLIQLWISKCNVLSPQHCFDAAKCPSPPGSISIIFVTICWCGSFHDVSVCLYETSTTSYIYRNVHAYGMLYSFCIGKTSRIHLWTPCVHACMQIHTLNSYRFYMHRVSKKNVLITKTSWCLQMLAALVTL